MRERARERLGPLGAVVGVASLTLCATACDGDRIIDLAHQNQESDGSGGDEHGPNKHEESGPHDHDDDHGDDGDPQGDSEGPQDDSEGPQDPQDPAPGVPLRVEPLVEARRSLDRSAPEAPPTSVTKAPLAKAFCQINVNGVNHDTETDYIPHVIQCENGGANLEALKAQAIAARSVAYYAMAENGKICDGQGCQVYSCNANPTALQKQAALETAGQYLSFNNTIKGRVLTYAFFVAGDKNQTSACKGADPNAGTEGYVTYNEGKTWTGVKETSLGFQFKDPNSYGYGQNRGCMSQWSARCLENNKGYNSTKILRYFYGDDIEIQQAEGPCVAKPNEPPKGALDSVDCQEIRGWAFDPDVGAPAISTTLTLGGPIGDANAVKLKISANINRPDLCGILGSCDHGFESPVPRSLMDGVARPVHAYAHDDKDDAKVQIDGSPKDLLCPPPELPEGVRRAVLADQVDVWGFDLYWSMAVVDDATLATRPVWKKIPDSPQLIQAEGAPEVYLVDQGHRRWIPSPEVAAAWGFDLGAVAVWPQAMVDLLPQGPDVRASVFLVRGEQPSVYLLDDLFCPEGGGVDDPLCPPLVETTGDMMTDTDGSSTSGTGGTGSSTGATASGTSGSGSGSSSASASASSSDTEGSGSEGLDGSASHGPGLPPGYGQGDDEGCTCTSGQDPRSLGWAAALVVLALGRRRRRSA
ncbi:MAG: SpoIID/LytB domain-containing protein [Nannocystaceae bacterium]